jgi:hypothetical protein
MSSLSISPFIYDPSFGLCCFFHLEGLAKLKEKKIDDLIRSPTHDLLAHIIVPQPTRPSCAPFSKQKNINM